MFFLRMITRSFTRQLRRRLLIALTVCLSATVSVSMLGVVFDVGDKLNAELSTYGSNITVQPKADAVVSDLYNTESGGATFHQRPDRFSEGVGRGQDQDDLLVVQHHQLRAAAQHPRHGERYQRAGRRHVVQQEPQHLHRRDYRRGRGRHALVVAAGRQVAQRRFRPGRDRQDAGLRTRRDHRAHTITLNKTTASGKKNEQKIKLTGVDDSGDEDNGSLYIASSTAQVLADLPDSVDKIEVKALTTPAERPGP